MLFVWYNLLMKKLYYATFEKGFEEIVKQIIKKQDKNSRIKTLYENAVLFFADERFKFKNSCFESAFVVIHNTFKQGVGAINIEMKNLLEKRDLKINLPKEAGSFKLTISKENEKVIVDNHLKTAFETMLKRVTKKTISFFAENELVLLAKQDGETLFMRALDTGVEFKKITSKFGMKPQFAYLMNFISNPNQNEVVVDAFADKGIISAVRAMSYAKANVIAGVEEEEDAKALRKLSKSLKDANFSVLNYDFLSDAFPIKFIDKVVTDLNSIGYAQVESYRKFFDKCFNLGVKTVVVSMSKNYDISKFISNKYEVELEIEAQKLNVYKLKIKA